MYLAYRNPKLHNDDITERPQLWFELSVVATSTKTPHCFSPIVAVAVAFAERPSIFGPTFLGGVGSFDQDQQDQEVDHDHEDNTYGSGFGVFSRMGEEQEVQDMEDNNTLLDGHYQDQRVENRGCHILPPASTVRHKTKTTKLGGNTLQQRSMNIMNATKKSRTNKHLKGGATSGNHIHTEAFFLQQEVDKANREKNELKRRLEALEKSQMGFHKKVKVVKRKVEAKPEIAGTWSELRDAFKKEVHPKTRFMEHEKDEYQVMLDCLKHTNEWSALKDLPGEELEEEVKSYLATYGSKMAAWMNECRSQDQTSCRNVWIDLRNKGLAATAEQLLKVALRPPKHLLLLDEDTGNEEVDAKNKEVNQEKKKYRDRFKVFLTKLVPTCIHPHGWTSQLQTQHRISDYVDKNGQAMVPASTEAMVIVLVENNQDKWEWQSGVVQEHGTVKNFKEKLKKEGRKLSEDEKEPAAKYSSSSCGPKKCGGWSKQGKRRYRQLERMITKAREQETTREIEEQIRQELLEELEGTGNKKAKDNVVAAPEEEDEDEELEDPGYESCDSEAEINALQRSRWLSDEEKRRLEQEKQNKEASRAEMEKQKKAQHQEVGRPTKNTKSAASAPVATNHRQSSRSRRNGS